MDGRSGARAVAWVWVRVGSGVERGSTSMCVVCWRRGRVLRGAGCSSTSMGVQGAGRRPHGGFWGLAWGWGVRGTGCCLERAWVADREVTAEM
jgi:hypothetical protein